MLDVARTHHQRPAWWHLRRLISTSSTHIALTAVTHFNRKFIQIGSNSAVLEETINFIRFFFEERKKRKAPCGMQK